MKIQTDSVLHSTLNLQKMTATDVEAVFYLDGHEHLRDPTLLMSLAPAAMTWLELLGTLRKVKQEMT